MCRTWVEAQFFALGGPLAPTPFVEKSVLPGLVFLHLSQTSVEDIEAIYLSTEECIKMWYIYTVEYYLAVKMNEIIPLAGCGPQDHQESDTTEETQHTLMRNDIS